MIKLWLKCFLCQVYFRHLNSVVLQGNENGRSENWIAFRGPKILFHDILRNHKLENHETSSIPKLILLDIISFTNINSVSAGGDRPSMISRKDLWLVDLPPFHKSVWSTAESPGNCLFRWRNDDRPNWLKPLWWRLPPSFSNSAMVGFLGVVGEGRKAVRSVSVAPSRRKFWGCGAQCSPLGVSSLFTWGSPGVHRHVIMISRSRLKTWDQERGPTWALPALLHVCEMKPKAITINNSRQQNWYLNTSDSKCPINDDGRRCSPIPTDLQASCLKSGHIF